jgi:hypothetical protein
MNAFVCRNVLPAGKQNSTVWARIRFNFTSFLVDTQPSLSRYSHLRHEIVFAQSALKLSATFKAFKHNFSNVLCYF